MATKPIEKTLYGDKYNLVFNPNARGRNPRYKVNGEAKKGVTTIIGDTLAKRALMLWPMDVCLKYIRDNMPNITEDVLEIAADEHNRLRNTGGSIGTAVHEHAELILNGGDKSLSNLDSGAVMAIRAFRKWFDSTKPEVLDVESVIYSESLNYCGTFDALLKIDGKLTLMDLKTTNPSRDAPKGIYAENFVQLGAYALAYEEQRQYEIAHGGTKLEPIEELMILSCKKNGACDIQTSTDLGFKVKDLVLVAKSVIDVHNKLLDIKNKLGG